MAAASVPKLYQSVIEDVISNVREAFIDEGVDEQILSELKQVWEKKLVESKAIDREPEPATRSVAQSFSQLQQQSSHVASPATLSHQLTVPAGNLMPQAVLQYTTTGGTGDGQKTMALNLPPKLTLTVPAHLAQTGLQTLVSTTPGTAVHLPPEIASFFQNSVLHASTHSNATQHGGQQITGLQYQTLTADQLQKPQQFTVATPANASQSQNTKIFFNKSIGGQQISGLQYQALTTDQIQKAQQFTVTIPGNTPQPQTSILQLDGPNDTSDDEEDDDFQDNDDDRDDNDEEQNDDDVGEEDEEPLNSDDDVSDDDPADLFDTDNVVVCQYDKITRSKNRWKFHLKDGIMNLQGKDFVFQKALGDSEW